MIAIQDYKSDTIPIFSGKYLCSNPHTVMEDFPCVRHIKPWLLVFIFGGLAEWRWWSLRKMDCCEGAYGGGSCYK